MVRFLSEKNEKYTYLWLILISSGFELVKQNRFTKISECSEEKDSLQAKNVLDLQIIL